LQNAPSAPVKLVAREISNNTRELAANHPNVVLVEKEYEESDLTENIDVVIAAVNDPL
jgi:siroheme synthase (precorrin-2 oxidase/ferrochelatase)